MRFLLFCCIDEDHWHGLEPAVRDEVMRDYGAWADALDDEGRHVASGKLQPAVTAVTVRAGDSKPVISDGPFAETKEQIGGYHILECADRDEAAAIASRMPTLRVGGSVEIRAFEEAADGERQWNS